MLARDVNWESINCYGVWAKQRYHKKNNDLIIDGENMLDGVEKESQANTEPKEGVRSTNSTNELFGQKKYTINSSLSPLIPNNIPNSLEFNQLATKLKEGNRTPVRKKLGIILI